MLFSHMSAAQNKTDDIVGRWLTAGKEPAKIDIYKKGENYYGRIIWLKNPTDKGKPRVDGNNPDSAKRNNPTIGLVMLIGFKFDGENEWKDGFIYDPESGKTYSAYLSLKEKNTLEVRGYVGISLFGRTETWTRVN
ncbi:SIGNAL peptide protein [Sphingobacteriaceae bacterium]|nr:SIGNAL peptide protein [Sphingobacteriaceae bacterium]